MEREGRVVGETNVGQFMEDPERASGILTLSVMLLHFHPSSFQLVLQREQCTVIPQYPWGIDSKTRPHPPPRIPKPAGAQVFCIR